FAFTCLRRAVDPDGEHVFCAAVRFRPEAVELGERLCDRRDMLDEGLGPTVRVETKELSCFFRHAAATAAHEVDGSCGTSRPLFAFASGGACSACRASCSGGARRACSAGGA